MWVSIHVKGVTSPNGQFNGRQGEWTRWANNLQVGRDNANETEWTPTDKTLDKRNGSEWRCLAESVQQGVRDMNTLVAA